MSQIDWIVLIVTLLGIIGYGLYRSRTTHNLDGYFLSNRSMHWGLILLSIMGTQASAITFLTAPGQAYDDGMRFVQYYFGLPIAMIVICIFFVPIFNKLKVYTAYEYLENRFDNKTRSLTSFLFLLQRGLSTGISVFAPSIILSSLLDWNIYWTNLFMGGLLIIYTISGGAKASVVEMFPAREINPNEQASQKNLFRVSKKGEPYRKPTQVDWRQIAKVNG